jgi:hypothetical protein
VSGKTPPRLSTPVAQWLRRHARQHDWSPERLVPYLTAEHGSQPERSVRDFLWNLKHQAIEAGDLTDPDDWIDAQTLIADLRADSDDAMAQYRDAFE